MTDEKVVMRAAEPPPARKRRDWGPVVKQLRRKPEKWHLVIENCKVSVIQAIRQGSVSALLPSKGFEVRQGNTHRPDDGPKRADLYLRYVPENDQQEGSTT